MDKVLMSLGTFKFEIGSNAYKSLSRKTSFRWEEIKTFGGNSAMHYTGKDNDSLSLSGTIFKGYGDGVKAFEDLKAEAIKAKPMVLVDINGVSHGSWVVLSISNEETSFDRFNSPRKTDFTIELRRYS